MFDDTNPSTPKLWLQICYKQNRLSHLAARKIDVCLSLSVNRAWDTLFQT